MVVANTAEFSTSGAADGSPVTTPNRLERGSATLALLNLREYPQKRLSPMGHFNAERAFELSAVQN
jgi:hypothetical protein